MVSDDDDEETMMLCSDSRCISASLPTLRHGDTLATNIIAGINMRLRKAQTEHLAKV